MWQVEMQGGGEPSLNFEEMQLPVCADMQDIERQCMYFFFFNHEKTESISYIGRERSHGYV